MIMAKEQAFLKAQEQFDQLKDLVEAAARDGHRIDTVERDLMGQLLGLGRTLLTAFVAQQGDGDQGPTIEVEDDQTLQRLPIKHDRGRDKGREKGTLLILRDEAWLFKIRHAENSAIDRS